MKILLVDDDLMTVKMTTFVLEDAGYQVVKAYASQDALPAITAHNPDLVLLDVAMPKQNGFEVCTQIRTNSAVPIIFLSARSSLEDRVHGLKIGGDDYLVKPFEPAELLARISSLLRRTRKRMEATTNQLTMGNITLQPLTRNVVVDGVSKSLTGIEFRLLHYMMRHSGYVLRSDVLLRDVWGYDGDTASNVVPVYIRRLRTKLEDNHTKPRYIMTVAAQGYLFQP